MVAASASGRAVGWVKASTSPGESVEISTPMPTAHWPCGSAAQGVARDEHIPWRAGSPSRPVAPLPEDHRPTPVHHQKCIERSLDQQRTRAHFHHWRRSRPDGKRFFPGTSVRVLTLRAYYQFSLPLSAVCPSLLLVSRLWPKRRSKTAHCIVGVAGWCSRRLIA